MNSKKRILLFIDSLGSGGAQRQIVNIAIALKNQGYYVIIVIYLKNLFYKDILDAAGIPVVLCTGNKLFRIFKVCKKINALKPEVVIAFLEGACFMACVSKMFGKKWRLITTERSAKESTFSSRRNKKTHAKIVY